MLELDFNKKNIPIDLFFGVAGRKTCLVSRRCQEINHLTINWINDVPIVARDTD